jgi:hypothetical protein
VVKPSYESLRSVPHSERPAWYAKRGTKSFPTDEPNWAFACWVYTHPVFSGAVILATSAAMAGVVFAVFPGTVIKVAATAGMLLYGTIGYGVVLGVMCKFVDPPTEARADDSSLPPPPLARRARDSEWPQNPN